MCVLKHWLPSVWLGGQQPVLGQGPVQKVPLQPGPGAPTWQFCLAYPGATPASFIQAHSEGQKCPGGLTLKNCQS